MLSRRRFIALAACATTLPGRIPAAQARWQGTALGSAASLTINGLDDQDARPVFAAVAAELARIEGHFSLHRDSSLTRLNRDGRLAWPDPEILHLLELVDAVHEATEGAFDPTVQPLWQAQALGVAEAPARALIGWHDVAVSEREIRLARPGMALTLNGIAQGHAADRIAALLARLGLRDVLVDMGEIVACGTRPQGGPWRAEIRAPEGLALPARRLALRDVALATSAPSGTRIGPSGRRPHILDPRGMDAPRWALAAIEAPGAALADALSTAACVMERGAIETALRRFGGARIARLA